MTTRSMVRGTVLAGVLTFAIGCGGGSTEKSDEPGSGAENAVTVLEYAETRPDGSDVVGAPLADDAVAATLADVLAAPEDFDGQRVRLTTRIDQVCQASGCWMIVGEGEAESRITFKDYGFFVPKDAAGRTVEMDVEIARETMSIEEAKHLASETEGQDPEAVTGPVETISVVATGVRILPAQTEGE